MTDPREKKLPKWAQEILTQERIKSALKFPDAPSPEPDFNIDGSGHGIGTPGLRLAKGGSVYSFVAISGSMPAIYEHFVDDHGYLHRDEECSSFGSRGDGRYWRSRSDAILAAKWAVCQRAAESLVRLDALDE